MWMKFTELSKRSILLAQETATQNGGSEVSVAHLILGVLRCEMQFAENEVETQNLVSQLMQMNLVDTARLETQLRESLRVGSSKNGEPRVNGEPRFTNDAKRVLELSAGESRRGGRDYIGPEHLLLAMACFDNSVRELLYEHDLDAEKLRSQLRALTGGAPGSLSENVVVKAVLSEAVRAVLGESQRQASLVGNGRVGTGHLLLALIHNGEVRSDDAAMRVLQSFGIEFSEMRQRIKSRLTSDNETGGIKPKPTEAARRALQLAHTEAENGREEFVQPAHLLLALAAPNRNRWRGLVETWRGIARDEIACEVLCSYDLNAELLRDALHNDKVWRASAQDEDAARQQPEIVVTNARTQFDIEIDWERENAL